ncbi:hypothetical protein GXW78_20285 [Roseomonas terrae]|uniref:Acyl-CoA dehydrogenase n=1 Tax=Neoroseomonas terrae TaxID=424799 RepID=A0ABS5ELX9_9PROT|nr:acyl-CoA dehydrogenase family protein [Neoroseomonas terrae]MBR0652013.1 hypothetical protein [Neoroseomonas terrae]
MSMSSSPGEDLLAIEEAANNFLSQEYDFRRRNIYLQGTGNVERSLWRRFADLGWLGLSLPEDYGGAGGSAVESWMLLQRLGAYLVLEPYLSSVVVCGWPLVTHGRKQVRDRLLPELIAGRIQLSLALNEPEGKHPNIITTLATPMDGGWRLVGHKSVVLGAPTADYLLLSARCDAQRIVLLIRPDDAGVMIRPYRLIDGRTAGEILFDGARVGPDSLLAVGPEADELLDVARLAGAFGCVAESVGVMKAALAATVEHVRARRQFGQALSGFQAIRHRIAAMHIACEEADALGWRAAQAYSLADPKERLAAIAAAKSDVGQSARRVCEEAVQFHGAIAITDEFPVGHYLKRAVVNERLFGNSELWTEHFSKAVFGWP